MRRAAVPLLLLFGCSPTPSDAPSDCTSGVYQDPNQQEGPEMRPGRACIACHREANAASGEEDAPIFAAAGTVYPSAHELDLCEAPDAAGAEVIVVDALGVEHVAPVNAVGNFHLEGELAPPFHARVRKDGRERVMQHAERDGDCNRCHAAVGAPGRILLP